jgi:hypothetical protein
MSHLTSEKEYGAFVGGLAREPHLICMGINYGTADLLHAGMGVASEGGEILDEIKKCVIYGAPLNRQAILKEMGDMEWYLQLLRNTLEVTRDEILIMNIEKLHKRHPNGFTTESALAKADAVEDANKELQLEAAKNLQSQQS